MPKRVPTRRIDEPASKPVSTLQVDNISVTPRGATVVKDEPHKDGLVLLSGPNRAGKSTVPGAIVYFVPFACYKRGEIRAVASI